jgi:hypothetical protein
MKNVSTLNLALLSFFIFSGCVSAPYRKTGRSRESMLEMKTALEDAHRQVTTTVTALDTLMAGTEGDLRPLFRTYDREVRNLERSSQSARERAEAMRTQNETFFGAWARRIEAIQDLVIREGSEGRFHTTQAEFKAVEAALFEVRDAYAPVIQGLSDLRTALGSDLTAAGVRTHTPSHRAVRNQAIDLQTAIRGAISRIDEVTTDLSQILE